MKRIIRHPFAAVVLSSFLLLPSSFAQVPGIINYQGRVAVNGTNFDGTGQFKFALVNNTGATRYWSNGVNAVSLTVTKGLYSVLLGDTTIANMSTAIPAIVFTNADVRLRVWFNSGAGLQQLGPDQRIAAAGYALTAGGLRVSPGNNVGIGTTNPGAQLEMLAPSTADQDLFVARSGHPAHGKIFTVTQTASDGYVNVGDALGNTNVHLSGYNYATAPSYILGKVGIGTNAPVSALHVNGTVTATSFSGSGAGLSGVNAATVINGVVTTGSYADPAWITSLAGSKITGNISGDAAGFTGSLAGDVTGTQGATVVGTVGGVSAANAASGATAANTATSANTPNTIVKRDGSGNFAAQTITLSGNLALPATSGSSVGVVSVGDLPFLHASGSKNTFVGRNAGNFTLTGQQDTANGNGALQANTTGWDNTAVGYAALNANTSGGGNTALGSQALLLNTNGNKNTALGFYTLVYNRSGSNNTATGAFGLESNTTGYDNTANGAYALNQNTTGYENTAAGSQALYHNTNGVENTANGYEALYSNTAGSTNTATGSRALWSNTTGHNNTAVGASALQQNTTSDDNTATGAQALQSNMIGHNNTANGSGALQSNTTGYENTATGFISLQSNLSGNQNTAFGAWALTGCTNGLNNTAVGWATLRWLDSGSYNIALGYIAGNQHHGNDSYNIDIGHIGHIGQSYSIHIGDVQTATYIAGISGATVDSGSGTPVFIDANGKLGTIKSSRRFKEAIADMGDQSDVLLSLRPVSFRYKPDLDPKGIAQYGLIAEEVEQVAPELVVRDAKGEVYSVRYEQVNAMLLNEFLKEHRQVQKQSASITELRNQNADLEKRLSELERRLNEGGK